MPRSAAPPAVTLADCAVMSAPGRVRLVLPGECVLQLSSDDLIRLNYLTLDEQEPADLGLRTEPVF